MVLTNKNIILTGASSGIGLALLKLLIKIEGAKIIAVSRNISDIPNLDNIIYPFSADVSLPEEIDRVFDYASIKLGDIDVFIANAGFAYNEKLNNADWKHNENIFALNTFSPIYSLQKLLTSNNNIREQYFVYIGSAVTKVVLPYYSLYCASKSATTTFLETYKYEAPKMFHISCVYPIATRTSFFEKASNNMRSVIPRLSQDPEIVAKSIIKGILKNKKHIYPSKTFRFFIFIGRFFPFVFSLYSMNEKSRVDKHL